MTSGENILSVFEDAALAAGRVIMDIYRAAPEIRWKGDASPVTEADEAAEKIILEALAMALPEIPIIAEEEVAAGRIPEIDGRHFILVDPLDGTREFIGGHDDFTVNIALIEDGKPIAGIVYAPALGVAYSGALGRAEKLEIGPDFHETGRQEIRIRTGSEGSCALISRSHNCRETDDYINATAILERRAVGSSLKFCLVAEGNADIYPRFSPTMEWDTAAGDAVLRAAGGLVTTRDGHPLTYGKHIAGLRPFENPAFIAWGDRAKAGMTSQEI